MFGPVGHFARLLAVGLTLARHDALFPFDQAPLPMPLRWLLRLGAWVLRRRRLPARQGERLALALNALGPTFVKFGQALSVRPDLIGRDLAQDLGLLRDRLPPFPAAAARAAIEGELGRPVASLYTAFDDRPVAAASIAQVHFAETEAGPVAVKVLRPGVEAAFRRDLGLFFWLAAWGERVTPLRRLRPMAVVQVLKDSVALELDLRFEAAAAAELAANFTDDPELRVPRIDWTRTARRVMTMERMTGVPVADLAALDAAGVDRKRAAANVIRLFLKQAMRDGFFHADLHHGNLFLGADGAVEAVDFGIMGRLDLATRRFMADMLYAFVTANWRRAAEVHFEAGYVPASKSVETFAQACRSIGEPILGRPVEEISIGRLLAQLFEITETFDMPTQPQLLLLQKTMVTVEGVARTLDPQVNFWEVARPTIAEWMQAHMGPAARAEDLAVDTLAALRRAPRLVAHLDAAAERLATGAPLPAVLVDPPPRGSPWAAAALWAIALLLLLLVLDA